MRRAEFAEQERENNVSEILTSRTNELLDNRRGLSLLRLPR